MVSPREAYQDAYANPLGAGVASDQAKYVLNRHNLLKKFARTPDAAIADLHEKALHDDRRDILYALSEVSYLYGDQLAKSIQQEDQRLAPDYFLLSALYAYYFAMAERSDPPPTAFDQRFRNACDLYNFGLWRGLATDEEQGLVLEGKTRKLPFGQLSISLDTAKLPWKMEDFEKFEAADKYAVRGMSVRNRNPGIGLPLIGIKKASKTANSQAVPVTAFLRIQGDLASLGAGKATATLELYSTQDTSTVPLNNREPPLETDITTPLAYQLEGADVWDFGIRAFLGKEVKKLPDSLYLRDPYRPGKIPVVFVHGTASSPVWWAEMFNTLSSDPLIRQKYQFWFFIYSSSKPIASSAAELRDALREKIASLDPEGKDAALQQMVVIGHSQGGLLTKMSVIKSGDALWRSISDKSIEDLDTPPEMKSLLRKWAIIEPLPFVTRVVYIATPFRGSFQAKGWVRNIIQRIVSIPIGILALPYDVVAGNPNVVGDLFRQMKLPFEVGNKIPSSVDGMSPSNPMLQTLAKMPVAPGVKAHSIIAIDGDDEPPKGDDGVVEYQSARQEGVESEYIVRSGHSCQGHPLTIEEVRRILLEHLKSVFPVPSAAATSAVTPDNPGLRAKAIK
jgi:pimeloyl-ACP methyl ester carboxylesterase